MKIKSNNLYKKLANVRGKMLDTIYERFNNDVKEIFGQKTYFKLKELIKKEQKLMKNER